MKGTALCQGLAAMSPILKQPKEYKYLTTVDQLIKLYFFHQAEYFPFIKKLYFNPPPPLPWGGVQWAELNGQILNNREKGKQKLNSKNTGNTSGSGLNVWCACARVLGCVRLSVTLWTDLQARLLCPWNLPGKNTQMGCHFLLQGTVQTQGSNPCLLHWQVDSLPRSYLGSQ